MIFVDANVFMYFIGADHTLRTEARAFFYRSQQRHRHLVTSAEVLQELLHIYLRRGDRVSLQAAFELAETTTVEVWPIEREDVERARHLSTPHPELQARDLVLLACCIRREPEDLMTFDRALAAAWRSRSPRRN